MIPYTLPYAMTGIRQAIARGLVGMVAAEFFLSASGIGMTLQSAAQSFDTATVFAAILLVTLLGVALMELGGALERRYAAWRNIK
jgi:ABC-type nitrate/sulfonate/bicarbonate transport system permease component